MTVVSQRSTLIVVAVIIACGVAVGLLLGDRNAVSAPAQSAPEAAPAISSANANLPVSVTPTTAPAVPVLSEAELARLGDATMAGPASSRVAAIEQLARAPREQALPLLKRVLLNGDPATDRPAALLGLRELALTQGDADQRIRDAVREVIYHVDDEKLASDAQDTLDVIAESEMK